MRRNLIRNYKRSWYLGLGANVNFNIKPTVVGTSAEGYVQNILPENMTKQWLNPVTYSPRVSFGVTPSLYDDELACRFYENRYSFDDVYLGGEMYWHLRDYVFTYCHNVYSKK